MNNQDFAKVMSTMPPLKHSRLGEAFDIERSEVVKWILAQPGVKDWVWRRAMHTKHVEYDAATGTWHGVRKGPRGRPKKIRAEIPMNDAAAPRVFVPEPMGMPVVTSSSAAEDLDA